MGVEISIMTMTKTQTKADYTSLTPERNYWIQAIILCVGLVYAGNIYHTDNNSDGINTPVATTTTTTANLVRGGVSNGDAGQEDSSSTSVDDKHIKSVTNSFVEEEEEKEHHLLEGCLEDPCYSTHESDEKACKGQGECYWFPHLCGGRCQSCAGVSCGQHRAPVCSECINYDYLDKGEDYCNGDCVWVGSVHWWETPCIDKPK